MGRTAGDRVRGRQPAVRRPPGTRARRRFPSRPVVATPLVVAATTGVLFAFAGALVLLAAAVASSRLHHVVALRSLGLTALTIGLVTWTLRGRLPAVAGHVLVGTGTVLITLAVQVSSDVPALSVALAGFYVLIAVDSAFFFSWPGAVAHLAFALCAALSVSSHSDAFGLAAGLVVGGTALLVAGVVSWLVRAAAAAEIDALTGLPNRRGLDRLLSDAVTTAQRSGTPLSLALIDLDHFKSVNDSQGHPEGDGLLRSTAAAWSALLEPGQALARQGGDEFTVLLPGASVAAAVELVERLRAAVPAGSTCSAGVAEWDPEESLSLLFASADAALYQAKRAGRNRTRHHSHAASLVADVRRALAHDELTVHYQPLVGLGHPAVVGVEALVRWQHPERGLLPPSEFLPLVESGDVMVDVGRFVLAEACAQAARWRSTGGPRYVGVNVSGPELLSAGYLASLRRILQATGLPASALVLEVTETSLDADGEAALEVLAAARALGVQVALDDFGTGYSSLSRLGRLPVDILKIDRSFVQDLLPDTERAPLVQAVIALGAALGLTVVAEGVEHPHQARLLASLGCSHVQGYLYSRPVPPQQLPLTVSHGDAVPPPVLDPVPVQRPHDKAALPS